MTKRRLITFLAFSLTIMAIVLFGMLSLFLYHYVWKTLSEVETIVLLQSEVAPVILKHERIELVLQNIEEKKKDLLEGKTIRDPF